MKRHVDNASVVSCNALQQIGLPLPLYSINRSHSTCRNESLYGDPRCSRSADLRYFPMCRSTIIPGSLNIGTFIRDKSTIDKVIASSSTRDPMIGKSGSLSTELSSLANRLSGGGRKQVRAKLIDDAPDWMTRLAYRHGISVCTRSSDVTDGMDRCRRSLGLPNYPSVEYNPSIVPLIESNTSMLMFPGISRRMVTKECLESSMLYTQSFMCPARTSLGPSVGMSRHLVADVMPKSYDAKYAETCDILRYMSKHVMGTKHNGGCRSVKCFIDGLFVNSCTCELSTMIFIRRVCSWRRSCPCLYVDWETHNYSISWSYGTLMKMSNTCGYYSNTERALANGFRCDQVKHLFSYAIRMIPYVRSMDHKRINLGANYISQAISYGFHSNTRMLVPSYEQQRPTCYTELTDYMMAFAGNVIPSIPASVGIMDDILVYEDGWIVSHSFALSHGYVVYQKHWVADIGDIAVGSRVSRTTTWWKYYTTGIIISIQPSDTGKSYIVETRRNESITDGVKMCTAFGNKGVVTVVNDDEMPITPDGDRIEVIIGSTTCIKRCSFAQLMAMNTNGLDNREPTTHKMMDVVFDGRRVTRRFRRTSNRTERVRINYGILDVFINFNTPCMRLNFSKTMPGMRSHMRRNDCSLGEMETIQIIGSNGLVRIGKELVMRGSSVRLSICIRCRVVLGCICRDRCADGVCQVIVNEGVIAIAKFKLAYESVLLRIHLNGTPGIFANKPL